MARTPGAMFLQEALPDPVASLLWEENGEGSRCGRSSTDRALQSKERLHGCGAVNMECVSCEMMGMLLDMAPPQKLEGRRLMQSGFA